MDFNIEISRDGYKILKVFMDGKAQYIGSKYNEAREIEKYIYDIGECRENNNYIVFGLACGEHIKRMLEVVSKKSKILIIEVNKRLIRYWENNNELSTIFQDERIVITPDIECLENFFEENITELNIDDIKLCFYGRYDKIFSRELEVYYERIKENITRLTLNRNTKLHHGRQWIDLFFENIKYMCNGIEVNQYRDRYKNIPAIIVSAGPSLSKNLDELKGSKNSLIISGGRTLKALMERDIEPDLLCVIDPLEESYKLVKNYIEKVECPLVFYEGTNDKIVKKHSGDKIFTTNSEFIKKVWNEDIQSLSGGGSVAHSMTILAAYMGCNPIVFVGQDLAYTNEQGHAICAEEDWEKDTFNEYKKDDDIYVEDINGDLVRTSITLNGFRVALENIISMFPNTKFINATEGGVNIKGAENRKLDSVLIEVDETKLASYNQLNDLKFRDNKDRMIEELNNNLNKIQLFMNLYNKRKIKFEEFKNIGCEGNELRELDQEIKLVIDSLSIPMDLTFNVYYEADKLREFIIYSKDDECEMILKEFNKNKYIFSNIKKLLINIEKNIGKSIDCIKKL